MSSLCQASANVKHQLMSRVPSRSSKGRLHVRLHVRRQYKLGLRRKSCLYIYVSQVSAQRLESFTIPAHVLVPTAKCLSALPTHPVRQTVWRASGRGLSPLHRNLASDTAERPALAEHVKAESYGPAALKAPTHSLQGACPSPGKLIWLLSLPVCIQLSSFYVCYDWLGAWVCACVMPLAGTVLTAARFAA